MYLSKNQKRKKERKTDHIHKGILFKAIHINVLCVLLTDDSDIKLIANGLLQILFKFFYITKINVYRKRKTLNTHDRSCYSYSNYYNFANVSKLCLHNYLLI